MGGTEAPARITRRLWYQRRTLKNAKACLRAYLYKKPAFFQMLAKKVKAPHTHRESMDAPYPSATSDMPAWNGLTVGSTPHPVEYDEVGEYPEVDEFGVWRMTSLEETSTYTTSESGL